jgi:hypothetical protein
LDELSHQLAAWRQAHKARTRISEELWLNAAELAREYGVGPVAKALHLDYRCLRQRMQAAVPEPAVAGSVAAAAFVEWIAPAASSNITECALIVEPCRGGRLRVELKNLPPTQLAFILRDFAG